MMRFSACIDMMFVAETADPGERIRLAAAERLQAVEFWRWSDKDLPAIAAALDETGLCLAAIVAEPLAQLTDPADHDRFLSGLARSVDTANRLGCPTLICQSGANLPDVERAAQRAALIEVLGRAADCLQGSGVRLGIEPLNDRIDHPVYFLTATAEALDIIERVDRPEIGITYDLYHSMVMGEDPMEVLGGRINRVAHLHVADHPGRSQPGSGSLPLRAALHWIIAHGYSGWIGLEFRPLGSTAAALAQARKALI